MEARLLNQTMLTRQLKSDFYKVLMPYTKAGSSLPAVFNTRDEALHKQIKSPIAPLYSLSNTISYEVHVDQVLDVMFNQLDSRFVETERTFDLGNWLQYFAFDVMGTLTFSKRYGLLEQGHDVNGMLETIWNFMIDAAPFTQIPWLDDWWRKNSVAVALRGSLGISFLKIVSDCIDERQQRTGNKEKGESGYKAKGRDMLSSFLEVAETNKSVPSWYVLRDSRRGPGLHLLRRNASLGHRQRGPSLISSLAPTPLGSYSKPSCTTSSPIP